MGQCPECGKKYDAAETQLCGVCKIPLWPLGQSLEPKLYRDNSELKRALGKVYNDIVVYPNASFKIAGVVHFRSAGCWCHPEIAKDGDDTWLEHHNETRN